MSNILFITSSLGFGGAAKILSFVASELSNRGYKVSIVNINNGYKESVLQQNISENVDVYVLPKSGNKAIKIKRIIKYAKNFKADIIIGFTNFPNLYAKIVSLILGIPSIMSERGDPSRDKCETLKAKVARFIINQSKGGVFQTEGAKVFYGKGLQKRGVVIPNPIFVKGDVPNVNLDEREKTIVSVGRLDNFQKRYDVMLDAFKIFNKEHPEYVLKLYGEGPDEEIIKQWAIEKEIEEKVLFMGLTTQPMQDISKDGIFIITSDYEGISNSLLEAMATGIPCVSTDHSPGGARLLINHGENGLLAPIGDSQKLADCMCTFAKNEELAKKCGENAKNVLIKYAPHRIIDMWEDYINKIIKNIN